MPQITLTALQVRKFSKFCKDHRLEQFFVAKDHGAYVGATKRDEDTNELHRIIFYFKGCDPNKDKDCWNTQQDKFGGDDFVDLIPASDLHNVAKEKALDAMVIIVKRSSIEIRTRRKGNA
jgi:hypothetical protein